MTTDPIPLSLSWSSKCFKTHFYWISGQTSSIFHSKWDQYCWDCLIRDNQKPNVQQNTN